MSAWKKNMEKRVNKWKRHTIQDYFKMDKILIHIRNNTKEIADIKKTVERYGEMLVEDEDRYDELEKKVEDMFKSIHGIKSSKALGGSVKPYNEEYNEVINPITNQKSYLKKPPEPINKIYPNISFQIRDFVKCFTNVQYIVISRELFNEVYDFFNEKNADEEFVVEHWESIWEKLKEVKQNNVSNN